MGMLGGLRNSLAAVFSNMQKQKLLHFCNRFSPDDGPKSGRKY